MARMTETSGSGRNRLRDSLAAGEPSFGLIATIPSVQTVQILANAGVDWLIIDMEHAPIDLPSAHAMIVATAGTLDRPACAPPLVASLAGKDRSWTWVPSGSSSP